MFHLKCTLEKEIVSEVKSEPLHVLSGRVSRRDEIHTQALMDKFSIIPAAVNWAVLQEVAEAVLWRHDTLVTWPWPIELARSFRGLRASELVFPEQF